MVQHKVDCFGMTDIGRRRETNQDHFLVADLNKSMLVHATSLAIDSSDRMFGGSQGRLMLVADGMGGHAAGQRASTLAIDNLVKQLLNSVHWFFLLDRDGESDFVNALRKLLENAHATIRSEGEKDLRQRGMGTTLTLAYAIWPMLYVVHAGDSRAYLIHGNEVEQLTTDHTLARRLVQSGSLAPEEEAGSRWSNVLWNVLGGEGKELTAEVRKCQLQPGDKVLLCSDGLYRHVNDTKLAEIINAAASAREACQQLIAAANEDGGTDNITAVVASFADAEAPLATTTVETEVPLTQVLTSKPPGNQEDTLPG